MTRARFVILLTLLPCLCARAADLSIDDQFEARVRPILVEHCIKCHGDLKQKGGLRLDSKAGWQKGGETGPAIVPKKAKDSLLIKMVRGGPETPPQMPPDYVLPAAAAAELVKWIDAGAPDPRVADAAPAPAAKAIDWGAAAEFWAFKPVVPAGPPSVAGVAQPIDRFIAVKLAERRLTPAPPADRRTLLRRATFDLTGLPPTDAEVRAFEADASPDAFARVVDRLLASPRFGEHQARAWLDVARYGEDQADSDSKDFAVPHAWRYRDWAIEAFNKDLPYDRFVKLQLAADLMETADSDPADRRALGLLGLGANYARPNDLDRKRAEEWDDRVDTITRGFLGLTVACARCHDHKYDPIPTQDYYSLTGVIASTKNVVIPLAPNDQVAAYAAARLAAITFARAATLMPAQLAAQCNGVADEAKPQDLRVYLRGNPGKKGEVAPRRFLRVLAGPDAPKFTRGSGRLELAGAIADPKNPLTARVMVNRIWQQFFGRGIVATASDFGANGERPTHPELLDYLADRFVKDGWSVKRLCRQVVLSDAYQRSSAVADPRDPTNDPENRWLSRMPRRRLTVEAFRDAVLAAAGDLDLTAGGPSGDLARPEFVRRTIYGKVSRHDLNELLRLFDFPAPNISSDRRADTTLPQQALFLMNSPFMAARAEALAGRFAAEPTPAGRVRKAYRLTLAREATEAEIAIAVRYLSADEPPVVKGIPTRAERFAQALLASNEFFYVD